MAADQQLEPRAGGAGVRRAPPFVGRAEEMALLDACLRDATGGRPRTVLVRGIAGVGKTRLVKEFGRRAAGRGAQPCYGRWHEDLSLPYLPFAEGLFRGLLDAAARGELPELVGEVESIARIARQGAAPAAVGSAAAGEEEKLRLFIAVSRAAVAWSRRAPLVLVFDDLHWSDRPSLELLSHLTFAAADLAVREPVPLVVIATYRADELGGEAARAVSRLQRDEGCAAIDLGGLGDAEIAELLLGMGLARPSRRFGALLSETTGGNPLFVQEAVHYLRVRGALQTQGGALVSSAAPGELRLPEDVRAAVAARLDEISPACREVLTLAAFLAAPLSLDALGALGAGDPPGLEAAVNEALASRLLQRDGDDLQFAHPLVRHVFYCAPTPARRRELHLHIADALQARDDGAADAHLLEIAHHLIGAGAAAPPERVLDVAGRAGDRAFALFAWAEAGRFYEAALAAAGMLPPERAPSLPALADLHLRAARAHYRASDLGPCQDQFDRAIAAYTRAGVLGQRAEALLGKLRVAIPAASYGTLVDTQPLEELLAALGEADAVLRGRIAQTLSEAYWHGRQTAKAEAMGRLALATAEQLRDERLCAEASHGLALAMMQGLHIREALSLWERSLAHARRSGDAWALAWPYPRIALTLLWLGEVERSRTVALEAAEAMRRIHDWAEYSVATAHLAGLAALRGDFAGVERLAQETMGLVAFSHYPWGGVAALSALAGARALRGAWDEAGDAIDALVEPGRLFEEPGAALSVTAWLYRLLIAAQRGEVQPASTEAAASMVAATGPGAPDMGAVALLCALVEIADACGDAALAAPAVPGLELAVERGVVVSYGWLFLVPRVLGVAAALRRDWPAAERHFAAAVDLATRIEARPELGHACFDWARMLAAQDTPASRQRAAALLRQAHAVSTGLGLQPLAQRSAGLAASLGVELPPAARAADSLTDGEARLLRLIARGAGEDAIAAELLVGPATVARLQARLFDKLGVGERAAAARAAADRGLIGPPEGAPQTVRILLFTDMVGSTAVLEALGDQRAQELLRIHNRVIRGCLGRRGGTEVKHTGDGVLATFRSAVDALECAIAIQQAFAGGAHEPTPVPIRVRIGINAGEPLAQEGDLHGAAVNFAARICARAGAGEILLSEVVRQLAAGSRLRFHARGRLTLKGFRGRHRLYTVELPAAPALV